MEIDGRTRRRASVDEYLEQWPSPIRHVQLVYRTPGGDARVCRGRSKSCAQPKEIKPHPYGIESAFSKAEWAASHTKSRTLAGFSPREVQPVSSAVAQEICGTAKLSPNAKRALFTAPTRGALQGDPANQIMAPRQLHLADRREGDLPGSTADKGDFYTAVDRSRRVRAIPFIIEAWARLLADRRDAVGRRAMILVDWIACRGLGVARE